MAFQFTQTGQEIQDILNQVGDNTSDISALDTRMGTAEGDITALNTSKSNLLTTREYTYSPSANIPVGGIDTYYIDVPLSGYTFLGVVGARVTGTANCPLLIADYASGSQAFVRVRNSSSSPTYPDQVVVRALYVKNS